MPKNNKFIIISKIIFNLYPILSVLFGGLYCRPSTDSGPDPVCAETPDSGTGNGLAHHWYFNVEIAQCREIVYRGEGGNLNRFPTQTECETRCLRHYVEGAEEVGPKIKAPVNHKDKAPNKSYTYRLGHLKKPRKPKKHKKFHKRHHKKHRSPKRTHKKFHKKSHHKKKHHRGKPIKHKRPSHQELEMPEPVPEPGPEPELVPEPVPEPVQEPVPKPWKKWKKPKPRPIPIQGPSDYPDDPNDYQDDPHDYPDNPATWLQNLDDSLNNKK